MTEQDTITNEVKLLAGSGICHVCGGTGMDPNDSSGQTNCSMCGSTASPGKCRNCEGRGCV